MIHIGDNEVTLSKMSLPEAIDAAEHIEDLNLISK
jgi:hypothetical protein